ncbi:MAG: DUF4037 domain-containing protein [Oscillospiraceae bacterium]|nr:DUF4037 domain-containing protein [Oscillospiraceae bacterium]
MNGIELSRDYFEAVVRPRLKTAFPDIFDSLAAGLVGNGSECFGFDDEISRDHDWGVDYFIWVPEELRSRIEELNAFRLRTFEEDPPVFSRKRSEYGARIGVMTVGDFYRSLIGFPSGPEELLDWRRVPEDNFAMVVNGEVFMDNLGEFTKTRNKLLEFFPEDFRRKKLAAKCMAIAQTGQYNFQRMARRGDLTAARTALSRFNDNVIAMVFLLNRVFKPYYKWQYRMMSELPILGADIAPHLKAIAVTGLSDADIMTHKMHIDAICDMLIKELRNQGLAFSSDWFMTTQGEEIQSSIQDKLLRSLPTQYE